MKLHDKDYNGTMLIECVANGFIVTDRQTSQKNVYTTFNEVVQKLGQDFGLLAIGEQVSLMSNRPRVWSPPSPAEDQVTKDYVDGNIK